MGWRIPPSARRCSSATRARVPRVGADKGNRETPRPAQSLRHTPGGLGARVRTGRAGASGRGASKLFALADAVVSNVGRHPDHFAHLEQTGAGARAYVVGQGPAVLRAHGSF